MSLRILVVDDDANTRDSLVMLLTSEGHVVEACPNGDRALARLHSGGFDVLLTDLVMPGMDGLELVSATREPFPKLRCFIMSGHAPVERGSDLEWIEKPIAIDALFATLNRGAASR